MADEMNTISMKNVKLDDSELKNISGGSEHERAVKGYIEGYINDHKNDTVTCAACKKKMKMKDLMKHYNTSHKPGDPPTWYGPLVFLYDAGVK